jgi:hypothetical protein
VLAAFHEAPLPAAAAPSAGLSVCVYMCICVYVYMCICVYVYMCICVYVYEVHVFMCERESECIWVYVCAQVCVYDVSV